MSDEDEWNEYRRFQHRYEQIEIAPDGDVIFVCFDDDGPYKRTTSRIRVSSALICEKSPVFKAMLAPKFREGTELAMNGYVEIELPDDHPDAMDLMFKALYGKHDEMSCTTLTLYQAALAGDKYDCLEGLALSARIVIKEMIDSFDRQVGQPWGFYTRRPNKIQGHLKELLECCYAFSLPELLKDIGVKYLLHSRYPMRLASKSIPDILAGLEAERQEKFRRISASVASLLSTYGHLRDKNWNCSWNCTAGDQIAGHLLRILRTSKLDLLLANDPEQSMGSMLNTMSEPDLAGLEDHGVSACCAACATTRAPTIATVSAFLKSEAQSIKDCIRQLSLERIQEGRGYFERTGHTVETNELAFADLYFARDD